MKKDTNFHFNGQIHQSNLNGNNNVTFAGEGHIDMDKEKQKKETTPAHKELFNKYGFLLWVVVIIISGFFLFSQIPVIQENYVGGILAFVGIMATFIVVSNYMQVVHIKSDFEKKVEELNEFQKNKISEIHDDINVVVADFYWNISVIYLLKKEKYYLGMYIFYIFSLIHVKSLRRRREADVNQYIRILITALDKNSDGYIVMTAEHQNLLKTLINEISMYIPNNDDFKKIIKIVENAKIDELF
ncbi:MAG: hypothetical protein LBG80_17030 [Bacteroidales bacterium]|jgi:hypothetical protein|nr:hypothetical protein [Bacteroidales bacterium]